MEELRLRGHLNKAISMAKKSFGRPSLSIFSSLLHELRIVIRDSRFRRIMCLGAVNMCSFFLLLSWCNATKSLGLLSYTHLIFFDILCLCICALSIWVEQKKSNPQFTYGYDRFEVLAIFMSTSFLCINSFFTIKKSIFRWIEQIDIPTVRLELPGIFLAFLTHMIVTYCMKNKGLNLVICASSTNWIQNRITSLSQSLLSRDLCNTMLPRINPFSLLGWSSLFVLAVAKFFLDIYAYSSADSIGALLIALMTCVTMYPLSAYCGKILLQGTPPHVADLLDKCLREASTLDGVLELRNEHFWLLGFDKIVGSIHVRIRRDANEQVVLSHLLNKLSSLVTDITIHVFKDEWTFSSNTRQILSDAFIKFPPVPETYTPPIPPPNSISSNIKETQHSNDTPSNKNFNSTPQIPTPNTRDFQHGYGSVPLPPCLSGSSRSPKSEHYSIKMSPTSLPSRTNQVILNPNLYIDMSKYGKGLNMDPHVTINTDFLRSHKS